MAAEKDTKLREVFAPRAPRATGVALAVALASVVVASFSLGRYPVAPVELVSTVCAYVADVAMSVSNAVFRTSFEIIPLDAKTASALFAVRGPRILVVVLVGAGLSVAGASYQGMFKNPLVSPDVLGASAGASLGASLALLLDAPGAVVQLAAFSGAIVAVALAVWFNKAAGGYDALLGLVLGGMLASSLFQAFTSLVKYLADANDKLPSITLWLMGSFNTVKDADLVVILPMVLSFVVLLLEANNLNALSFGEEEARSLGVDTSRTRAIVICAATLLVACSVAVAGIIGWVGLVIPHLVRSWVGPNYRVLLPFSMVVGAGYLLVVDDVVRLVSTVEMPIGILTAILGIPFFVYIFKKSVKGW